MTQLEAFQSAFMQGVRVVQHQTMEYRHAAKQWVKPNEQQVKFNWDATLNVSKHATGLEGLIRDSRGEVMVAFNNNLGILNEAYLAEALALRKAMVLCWNFNFR